MRIYVDFNTMMTDLEERVYINTKVSPALAPRLWRGLDVVLYDETLEVHALIELDRATGVWYGRPRWSTSRDLLPDRAQASERSPRPAS